MQVYAIERADEGIMHKSHMRGDIDNGVGELQAGVSWIEGSKDGLVRVYYG